MTDTDKYVHSRLNSVYRQLGCTPGFGQLCYTFQSTNNNQNKPNKTIGQQSSQDTQNMQVKVGNDQEMAPSERYSHSKNQSKTKLTIRYSN